MAFVTKVAKWVAKYGKEAVKWVWAHKAQIIEWGWMAYEILKEIFS